MGRGDWSGRRPGQLRTWSPGRSCPPAARPHCDLVRPPCPQHRHRPAHENRLAPRGDSGTPCRVPTPTATPILYHPRGPRVSEKPSPCGARGATPAESSGCWPGGDAAQAGPPTCAGQLLRGGCQLLQTCRGDVIAVRVQRRKLLAPSEHSICEKRRQRGRGSDFPFSERRTTLLTPLQRAPRALCGGFGTGLQAAAGPRGAAESANARLEEGAGAQRGLVFQSAPVPSSPAPAAPTFGSFLAVAFTFLMRSVASAGPVAEASVTSGQGFWRRQNTQEAQTRIWEPQGRRARLPRGRHAAAPARRLARHGAERCSHGRKRPTGADPPALLPLSAVTGPAHQHPFKPHLPINLGPN